MLSVREPSIAIDEVCNAAQAFSRISVTAIALLASAARVVSCVTAVLCIGYSLVLAWGGLQYVLKMHDVGILMQDVPVAQWIPRVILPAGFVLLAFRFVQVLLAALRGESVHMISDESHDALKLRDEGTTGLAE